MSKRTGRCLSRSTGPRYPDSSLTTRACSVSENQLWWVSGLNSAEMTIGEYSGTNVRYTDKYRIDWGYPNRVQTYAAHGGMNQRWRNPFHNQFSDPSRHIVSMGGHAAACMDSLFGQGDVYLSGVCAWGFSQKWQIEERWDGYYAITTLVFKNGTWEKHCLRHKSFGFPSALEIKLCVPGEGGWSILNSPGNPESGKFMIMGPGGSFISKLPRTGSSDFDLVLGGSSSAAVFQRADY